jgi:hypothetical protein
MITMRSALFGTVFKVVFILLTTWDLWPMLLLDAALIVGAVWKE